MSILELVFYAIIGIVIVVEALRLLTVRYILKHQHSAPRGQFKITMPEKQWREQIEKGAIAVAITNKDGQVYMTLLVEKGAPK